MLEVVVPDRSGWDESRLEFVDLQGGTLQFEHSLLALSKWEIRTGLPFLDDKKKTPGELTTYFECMCLTPETQHLIPWMTIADQKKIIDYIYAPMTATKITDRARKPNSKKVTTSEEIYGWMVLYRIPFDPCENWHLARLMMLIRVCGIQQDPNPKKLSRMDTASSNAALNAARRAKYGTKG